MDRKLENLESELRILVKIKKLNKWAILQQICQEVVDMFASTEQRSILEQKSIIINNDISPLCGQIGQFRIYLYLLCVRNSKITLI